MLIRPFAMLMICLCSLYMATQANADQIADRDRGQLLYEMHCQTCHTSKVHWRENRKVTDWNSLLDEVRRWQNTGNLNLNDSDIEAIAHYLDRLYYGYKSMADRNMPGAMKEGWPLDGERRK